MTGCTMAGEVVDPRLREVLTVMRPELEGFAGRRAGELVLRYEAAEDLAQGVIAEALQSAAEFEYRGEREARAWAFRIARRHLSNRRRHWLALKRSSGPVLRLDWTDSGGTPRPDPIASQTGPSTFAFRREQLVIAARALGLLPPRDRQIVTWEARGVAIEEQGRRMGLSYAAAVSYTHLTLPTIYPV